MVMRLIRHFIKPTLADTILYLVFIWSILAILIALVMQHIFDKQPCVMCIYERIVVMLVFVSTGLAYFFRNGKLSLVFLLVSLGLLIKGIFLTSKHIKIESGDPSVGFGCSFLPEFPSFMPLHEWVPALFKPYASCDVISGYYFGITLVQWLNIFFAVLCFGLLISLILKLLFKSK